MKRIICFVIVLMVALSFCIGCSEDAAGHKLKGSNPINKASSDSADSGEIEKDNVVKADSDD